MLDFIIFAVTFVAALAIAVIWLYPASKAVTAVPGLEPTSKELGNLGDVGQAGSLHQFLMDLHVRFGPISGFWWGQTYVVSIASPELMSQHQNVFDRPVLMYKNFEKMIGPKCIQYANGVEGRGRRKIYDQLFAHKSIEKYMTYFNECVQRTEAKWSSKSPDDHISLTEDCFVYAIHVASLSILGDFYKDNSTFLKFKQSYDTAWSIMESYIANPEVLDDEKLSKRLDEALDFLKSSIKKAVAYRKEKELHLQNNQFIDVLIENCTDEETLLSDAIAYLVGSFHTSGNLLIWGLYYIAKHREVQDKLYKEVKEVMGENGNLDEHNFSQLVYLIQVIDETLRCSVIAPMAARVQDFDSELGGHKIPKDTPVIHALGVLAKDPKLWPSPDKFDPERFSPENRKKISTHGFVPFGFAGKRKCPGYRYAYWDTAVFLATMIHRFEIQLCNNGIVKPVYGLVTHPEEEIWVKVKKRNTL